MVQRCGALVMLKLGGSRLQQLRPLLGVMVTCDSCLQMTGPLLPS